jgi:DNA (cytosine-5)-methyltransferase 1
VGKNPLTRFKLTANMGMGGHNVPIILDDQGIRKLTPKECANFQGYPKVTLTLPSRIIVGKGA